MILLSSIIEAFEGGFLKKYKTAILPSYKNALWAMKRCRMDYGPRMLARCTNDSCRRYSFIPHSCGHRSCPHCQHHEGIQWIENQLSKQVPAQYYLITFTLPKQLRTLAWENQRTIYSLMFECVQKLLKTFTANDKKLQGMAGFTAVLHTHSRRLGYHPHIHVVMPAAGINKKTRLWRVKSGKYLFAQNAMAKVFRAMMLKAIVAQHLRVPKDCPEKWVVDCKNVGNGHKALIYLGNYLYRGVIREKDIIGCQDGKVTFRYLHAKTKKYRTRTVSGEHFLWLLLQHVLPKGFRKVRCYGFLHPCSKKIIRLLQHILRFNPVIMLKKLKPRPEIICKSCGAKMKIICTMIPARRSQLPANQ